MNKDRSGGEFTPCLNKLKFSPVECIVFPGLGPRNFREIPEVMIILA